MRISEQWLRTLVDPPISTTELVQALIMAGIEVDSFGPISAEFSGVVVGEVLSVEPHPNADRLRLCQVQTSELLSIVCGAANVRAGLKVAVAQIGAQLPGDFKIKRSKIRGIESQGMLCSAQELGLETVSEGIIELPADAPVSEDLRRYLNLEDYYLDLEVTPNRGDCLSILGIAREVAAITKTTLKSIPHPHVELSTQQTFPVQVAAPADCPRYLTRVITHINVQAETPAWMAERLQRCGHKCIHPVVDVTNYVLLELGQPLHAFDLDLLQGGITVRRAQEQESVLLLNNQQVTLNPQCLVIADEQKILALAGIMGGLDSSVTTQTQHILLESAFFNPATIAGRARKYNAFSDSAHRFERGVDPQLQRFALERATALLLEILGGQAGPITEMVSPDHLPPQREIYLPLFKVAKLLNIALSSSQVIALLHDVHFKAHETTEGIQVQVPSFRLDVHTAEDLIEEIARLYGYDHIPVRAPHSEVQINPYSEGQNSPQVLADCLVQCGYAEAITYSFVEPQLQSELMPEVSSVALLNPISPELSVMRTSLWPGLLSALGYNLHRQQDRIRLFEIGRVFLPHSEAMDQPFRLGGVVTGSVYPEQWGVSQQAVDFFAAKGHVEALFALTRKAHQVRYVAALHPALHPGQSCQIFSEDEPVGWLGMLHPKLATQFETIHPIFMFEIQLSALLKRVPPHFHGLSKFPAIRRDLALLVDKDTPAQEVLTLIGKQKQEFLQDFWLFDVYSGKGIPSDKKSFAIALILQHQSRTLRDEEVVEFIANLLATLKNKLHAILRE